MKTLFLPAPSLVKCDVNAAALSKLPQPVGIICTVQHEAAAKRIAKEHRCRYLGVVLGCDSALASRAVRSFLFIGSGSFHPLRVAMMTDKPVYLLRSDGAVAAIDHKAVERMRVRRVAMQRRFLAADSVGVLVSTKPGQRRLHRAYALSRRFPEKRWYFLLADTFELSSLAEFPFIKCFVNTACPRIAEDTDLPMLNLEDVPGYR